jgi:O-acetyl-ADP-ribose deacetylase (regulator of RNase III)
MNQGRDAGLLADCYQNSLLLAYEKNLQTIAFPSISTGAFCYPKHEAARISSQAIKEFLSAHPVFAEIRLVFFSESDADIFLNHNNL